MRNFKDFCTKSTLIGLGLGQFLSLLITSTGFASSELAKRGINAPTSQSFINYVLLAIVYGSIVLYRKKALKAKWYFYIPLGLVDVEANYLVVKAYQYTSLTSVMLLDCWTIPCVMLLAWLFLKTKYRFRKIAGVVVCVAGLVMVIFSDVHAGDRAGGSSPLKGDALVIAGATLYAVTNVSEEFLVKNADRVELMAMLGIFGAIISAIQISIIERNELKSIRWTAKAAIPFAGFSVAMFLFYSLVPILLQISGSTMLNLSLLTSDMWSIVIRVAAYNEKVDWLYYLAFAAVIIGLIIYSMGDKEEEDQCRANVGDEEAEHDKRPYKECPSRNRVQGISASSSKI
ncbi:solute carrier family 35 member F1-like [Benincasa hispida]|uniref:solute carrier family 35 member F1-like n=1 Tax=Benincasa hispida TaxID=102211 RepID=UPI001901C879|nr:solute carrier family 35 member F1-like [Benincasa hispida]XP_038886582.1 solute carrier family 35 member F1-like [Benincasa hispida]